MSDDNVLADDTEANDIDGNVADDVEDDDEDWEDEEDDDVGAEGNRIVGARARAVVEHVARAIAEEPDAVDVEVRERGGEITILVQLDPSDMGRMIGKRGRVIQALRQVTRAAGAAEGVRATVDVVE